MRLSAAALAWLVLGIAACGEDSAERKPDPQALAKAACEEAIAKAASADPVDRAEILAEGCVACPGLDDYVQKQPPSTKAARPLLADCTLAEADGLWFPLPMPASLPEVYVLPTADRARPVTAAAFVLIAARTPHVGTTPMARFEGGELIFAGDAPFEASPMAQAEKLATAVDAAIAEAAQVRGGDARGVVLLADKGMAAGELLTLASESGLERGRLGVAGPVAMAHDIELEIPSIETAAPVIHIDDRGFSVAGAKPIPRGKTARLQITLRNLVAERAPLTRIVVEASGNATVADLAVAFDAAAAANIHTVLLPLPPADE